MTHTPSIGSARPLALTLSLLATLLLLPAVSQAGVKAPAGEFGTPAGHGKGQLEHPDGVAVNGTGAGGVSPGDVYVVDGGDIASFPPENNRIVEFSADGAFVRAFGEDVVKFGGQGNVPGSDEIQSVKVKGTGGKFSLDFEGQTTGALGTGNFSNGSTAVSNVKTTSGTFAVGERIKGGGVEKGTTIIAVGAGTLTLSQPAKEDVSDGSIFATDIAYNASAGEVQTALNALVTIASVGGSVSVSGGPGDAGGSTPYQVSFEGAFTGDDVSQLSARRLFEGNEGEAVTVETTTPGGGNYEICSAISSPADECKAGTLSAAAGGMSKPQGIAIDQATGAVYVTDANEIGALNNARVNVYSATGKFEGSFGWHVNATTPEEKLQFCTAATGCQKGTGGGGAGQLSPVSPRALPAIDPGNGHLYVPEGGGGGAGNFRVEEFAPTLNGAEEVTGAAFVKAIGWDVVAGGPDQADEIQLVRVKAGAGKFKLKYKGESTAEIVFNATPAELATALNDLSTLEADGLTATVSGGPGDTTASHPYEVTLHSSPDKGKDAEQLGSTNVSLSGGSGGSSVATETYSEGSVGLEVCAAAHPADVCKAGLEAVRLPPRPGESEPRPNDHLGQFSNRNPTGVAVDGGGTLYAVNEASNFSVAPGRVLKFTFPAPGEVTAEEFAPDYLTQESGDPSALDPTDVAVDPETDNVVVAKKEGTTHYKLLEFDSSGTLLFSSPVGTGLPVTHGGGLAIGTEERLYFTDHDGGVIILGPPPPPSAEMLAVGEVEATTATFQGKVTLALGPLGERFQTGYHFEYSKDGGASWTPFPETDVVIGDGHVVGTSTSCPTPEAAICEVSREVSGLIPNTEYEARIVASNGSDGASTPISFTTEKAPPGVSGTVAAEITQTTATLTAQLNPNNEATTYRFQWGESTAYDHETPEASAGSGNDPLEATAPIAGLEEGTAYHFRILATNPSGTSEGPDQEFTTLNSFGLPGGREPEQVSANDKRPVGMVAQLLEGQIRYQAADDGDGAIYPVLNGLADATGGGNVMYLGERGTEGWPPTQLTPPSLISPISVGVGEDATGQVKYASGDLSCQLIQSPEPLGEKTPELEDNVAKGVINLFRRNADGTHTLLSPQPINFETLSGYHIDWASADCGQILFDTGYRLLPDAPASGRGLYEWDEGTLRLAGILPDGSVAASAVAGPGDGNYTNVNSISEDGAKVFFTAVSNEGDDSGNKAIFMRENGTETTDISQSEQTGTVDQGAVYAIATPDGSAVFFLANYGLAQGGSSSAAASCSSGVSGGNGTGCDLYRYDTDTSDLTDLSADANPADKKGASVVGLLDASEDGSRAYFAARGQLVPDQGKTEAQNLAGKGSYNLYLNDGGALSYVGPIAAADASVESESGSDLSFKFGRWVADATPDGGHLLFVSKEKVTAYPAGTAAQVYLYSAGSGETACLSCRPDGQPSLADGKAPPLKQVTQKDFPSNTDTQHRPRSISDDGRHVFFTMPDVLAPGAKADTNNVYEWSEGQLYLLLAGEEGGVKDFTEFEDSSPDGKDVFLVTKAKLVPQDFDRTTDLYDLRAPHVPGEEVGPGPLVVPPTPCDPLAEACQGPPAPQPAAPPAPGSEAFSGPGNPPLAKPKPHRKKHRKHNAKKHKHHNHQNRRASR